ncbi:MAG: hypothetical protein ACE5HN_04495 [Nitrospiria bacterium]
MERFALSATVCSSPRSTISFSDPEEPRPNTGTIKVNPITAHIDLLYFIFKSEGEC